MSSGVLNCSCSQCQMGIGHPSYVNPDYLDSYVNYPATATDRQQEIIDLLKAILKKLEEL